MRLDILELFGTLPLTVYGDAFFYRLTQESKEYGAKEICDFEI